MKHYILISDLNTLNLAILNQLQGYADGMLTVVTRNIVRWIMPTAYVLINYEIGAEKDILNKLKTVPGVIEASEVAFMI